MHHPRLVSAQPRPWLSGTAQAREAQILDALPGNLDDTQDLLDELTSQNRHIHEVACVNLNPATNVMNPSAEAMLGSRLGSRPSLGHAGEKYEMGLEAIEQIEVIAADLACRVMGARFAEVRVPSGSIGNLYSFMAICQPGDSIIVPPPAIGGHVTHDRTGAAGLYGLDIHYAPVDADRYTVDTVALADLADRVRPKLITIGGSLPAGRHGGGQPLARHLRRANILASGIGLPSGEGLRLGTPEIVRWGMTARHMPELAALIARGLGGDPASVAGDVTAFRSQFDELHFIRQ